ncbi:vesicular glutamate transporter 1-like [Chironomus tepperi]|uniref:vesicular glutamate transporter 1-like n=1 Tax=Chironomus tepperi TaxID=113505 RepID=UPI00391F1042
MPETPQNINDEDPKPASQVTFEPIIRPPLRSIDKYSVPKLRYLSQRYTVAVMISLGLFVLFGIRSNLETFYSSRHEAILSSRWKTAFYLDDAYIYCLLLTQIPGGILAYKYPANKIFGYGILCLAILNFIMSFGFYSTVWNCIDIIQMFIRGLIFPAALGVLRFWMPPLERGRLATIAISGAFIGMMLGNPITEYLMESINWRAAFIFFAILGTVWYGLWYWLIFEKPRDHPAISEQELMFIEQSLGDSMKLTMPAIPWVKILTSIPVYAVLVATICQMWTYFLIQFWEYEFLEDKFYYRINQVGLIGAMPNLIMTIIVPLSGLLTDFLRQRKITTTTNIRKIVTCVSFGLQGIFFWRIRQSRIASEIVLLILMSIAFSGFGVSGYVINIMDIAPRFSTIVIGIMNTVVLITGIICLYLNGGIIHYLESSWDTVFAIPACMFIVGAVIYGIFSSGELQSWAEPTKEDIKDTNNIPEGDSLINDASRV